MRSKIQDLAKPFHKVNSNKLNELNLNMYRGSVIFAVLSGKNPFNGKKPKPILIQNQLVELVRLSVMNGMR